MKNVEVADKIQRNAERILTAWLDYVVVNYCGDDAKRKYALHAYHKWGTAYCDWKSTGVEFELKQMLKECGATYISGKVTWNRVDIYFNLKKSLEKAE